MPLSIVQDAAVLPPSQPVPPEALPPLDPPGQAVPRTPPVEPGEAARRRSTARKSPEAGPSSGPVAAPAPVAASLPSQPATPGTLVSSEPNLPGREALVGKLNDLKASAAHIANTSMSTSQRLTFKRVQSFIKLSEGALARGDLRQAGELADRAATLARALNRDN